MSNEAQDSNLNQTLNEVKYKYAGFWIRVGAAFIDGLIFIPVIIFSYLNMLYFKNIFLLVIITIPGLLYKPFMESKYGATLGKMACKIKIIDYNGQNLSLAKAYIRFIPYLLSSIVSLLVLISVYTLTEFQTASIMEIGQLQNKSPFNLLNTLVSIFILIDCLIVAFNNQKRAVHDLLANSYCIYKNTN